MPFKTDPKAWRDGFRDGYAARQAPVMTDVALRSYQSGQVEGDLLRTKHRREYETHLSIGSHDRPIKTMRF